jgi:succinate dehydrogenase / fumarate reductase flavoprotein subunit
MPEFAEEEEKVRDKINKVISLKGNAPAETFHRNLGLLMWENCGMARTGQSLEEAIKEIPKIQEDFWKNARVPGQANEYNPYLERALRIADYFDFAQLMVHDAHERKESCGGHFREESQTDEGEAQRDDKNYCHVAAWQFNGVNRKPTLHKEELVFENIALSQRSYK